jgi:hypothetical protein
MDDSKKAAAKKQATDLNSSQVSLQVDQAVPLTTKVSAQQDESQPELGGLKVNRSAESKVGRK